MRRAARTDGNHKAVVQRLRAIGAVVVDLSRLGGGVPDLLVGLRRRWLLLEVKDGSRPPSGRTLTDLEVRFFELADQYGLPAVVVTSADEAVEVVAGENAKAHPTAAKASVGGTENV